MCRDGWFPWQRDVDCLEEQQAERRRSHTLHGSPGFRTVLLRQPDNLRSAHHDHRRPYASCGQCDRAVVDHRLRPRMTGRHSMSGKARNNTGRDARYVITDVTRPPQRPLPNGRDEALPRPCDGWSGWLWKRLHGQRYVAGRGGVSARGGRLRAADRVGRGADQRAGGAKVPLECFSQKIKSHFNGRAIETGGTHFD